MSGMLDDAFDAAQTQSDDLSAYTIGTPENVALNNALAAIQGSLQAGAATADQAVVFADLSTPMGLLALCDAAEYQAEAYATLASLENAMGGLG